MRINGKKKLVERRKQTGWVLRRVSLHKLIIEGNIIGRDEVIWKKIWSAGEFDDGLKSLRFRRTALVTHTYPHTSE